MKCIACGSTALVEGALIDTAGGRTIGFQPADISTFRKALGMGTRAVHAYGCIHCHHIQFAVDFNEEDAEKYHQFEGQQPDVLERINAAPEE